MGGENPGLYHFEGVICTLLGGNFWRESPLGEEALFRENPGFWGRRYNTTVRGCGENPLEKVITNKGGGGIIISVRKAGVF